MTDPTFRNINSLFVLSFKNSDDDLKRNPFRKYYIPLVEITDFNALIDNKPFLINLSKILKCQEMMIIQQGNY